MQILSANNDERFFSFSRFSFTLSRVLILSGNTDDKKLNYFLGSSKVVKDMCVFVKFICVSLSFLLIFFNVSYINFNKRDILLRLINKCRHYWIFVLLSIELLYN